MLRTCGDAFEHTAALMGITVHPLARSESVSENMKSVVRSSHSCWYLTSTAITVTFSVILSIITALTIIGLISSKSVTSILACPMKHIYIDITFSRSANKTIHKYGARVELVYVLGGSA